MTELPTTPDAPMASPRFSWLARLGGVVLSVVIALVVCEIALRFVGVGNRDVKPTDTRTGLRTFPPNQKIPYRTACYSNIIQTNSDGFHAREHARGPHPGVTRIVVLGDSFVEAAQVDVDHAFVSILEDKLNATASGTRFEVIPVGMGGNGTWANLQYLAAYGLSYDPDLVIDVYNINDIENDLNEPQIEERTAAILAGSSSSTDASVTPSRPGGVSAPTAWIKSIAKRSALVITAYTAYLNLKARETQPAPGSVPLIGASMYLADPPPDVRAAWERQEKLFAAIRELTERSGARFLLASLTADNRVNEVHYRENLPLLPSGAATDPEGMEKQLTEIAGRLDVPYLPTVKQFSTLRNASSSAAWPCDGHYNEAGNEYLASILYEHLFAHPELTAAR